MLAEFVDKITRLGEQSMDPKLVNSNGRGTYWLTPKGKAFFIPDQKTIPHYDFDTVKDLVNILNDRNRIMESVVPQSLVDLKKDLGAILKSTVFVSQRGITARFGVGLDFKWTGMVHWRPTAAMETFLKLQSWTNQKGVFEALSGPLYNSVPSEIFEAIQKVHLTRKEESGAEINAFGQKTDRGQSIKLVFPSRKDGSTQETTLPLEWNFKFKPRTGCDYDWTFPTRLAIDLDDGLSFRFVCHEMESTLISFSEVVAEHIRIETSESTGVFVYSGTDETTMTEEMVTARVNCEI